MNIKEMVEVMLAADEGEDIQRKMLPIERTLGGKNWFDHEPTGRILWDWATFVYRVKPREPQVRWFNVYKKDVLGFETKEEAVLATKDMMLEYRQIKFVEVIDE